MSEILERLRKATGPGRELDAAIEVCFHPFLAGLARTDSGGWIHPEFGFIRSAPEYTASIDEALKLVERCLPGAEWEITMSPVCARREDMNVPLAILIALFTALESQEQK